MNYALVAGGVALAYYLWVSMKKPQSPGYSGGQPHMTEDGEISTMPYY